MTTNITAPFTLLAVLVSTTIAVDAAAQTPTELLQTQVTAELLREGVSLKRLGLILKIETMTSGGYLIELQQASNGQAVAFRKLEQLPANREAAVAELTVAVARMLVTLTKSDDAATETRQPTKKTPLIRINSDDPATELFVHEGTATSRGVASDGSTTTIISVYYSRVCGTPCNEPIERKPGAKYFIAGDGITASRAFLLPDDQSSITIDVDTGSAAGFTWGSWMSGIGLAAAMTGAVFLGLSAASEDSQVEPWQWGLIGGGVAFTGGGIGLMLGNRTHTEIRPGDRP